MDGTVQPTLGFPSLVPLSSQSSPNSQKQRIMEVSDGAAGKPILPVSLVLARCSSLKMSGNPYTSNFKNVLRGVFYWLQFDKYGYKVGKQIFSQCKSH